jgi:hypothetical protein
MRHPAADSRNTIACIINLHVSDFAHFCSLLYLFGLQFHELKVTIDLAKISLLSGRCVNICIGVRGIL